MLVCKRLAWCLGVFCVLAWCGALLSGGRQGTPAKGDPERIAQLIEQLGNAEFTKRDAASTALAEIGLAALPALKNAARSNDPEVARRAARLIGIIQPSMDQLLDVYRDYGLPLPPADAKLVRIDIGSGYIVNSEPTAPSYLLGFLLQPAIKEKGAVVLVGTYAYRLDKHWSGHEYEVIEPRPVILKNVEACPRGRRELDGYNAGLATALQFRARGWNEL